ncbi:MULTISPECIES: hypothetical protein [unclassified Microbacterium]|uniref:SecDF P1 head subdomain-containing protein n=1 Tax=unclassified Microbacterium TaxID=2609290 RepID=UPI00365DA084
MRRAIRFCVLGSTAAVLLTGCTALPISAPALTHEVVLSAPAGTADAVAAQLGHRLDVAEITERRIVTAGDTVTVRYNPPQKAGKDVEVREELFRAPGAFGIRPVTAVGTDAAAVTECGKDDAACTVTTDDHEVLELGPAGVTEKDLRTVKAVNVQNQWGLQVDFTKPGADAFATLSGQAACEQDPELKRMAILLDGKLLAAPTLQLECGQSLSDSVQISGGFDRDKAAQYSALMGTSLPDGVEIVSSKP